MRERSLALGQRHCREVSTRQAGFLLEREGREKRPTSHPLDLATHWLNSETIAIFGWHRNLFFSLQNRCPLTDNQSVPSVLFPLPGIAE